MVGVIALSASAMLIRSIVEAKGALETMSVNRNMASTLLCVLTSLQQLLQDLDEKVQQNNVRTITELDSIVNEVIQATNSNMELKYSRSPYHRLCKILFARSVHVKLTALLNRFNSLVATLQLATIVQEQNRRKILDEVKKGQTVADEILAYKSELRQELSRFSIPDAPPKDASKSFSSKEMDSMIVTQVFKKADSYLNKTGVQKQSDSVLDELTAVVAFLEECDESTIKYEDLQFGEMLGRGGFGYVIQAEWNKTPVAVKVIQSTLKSSLSMGSMVEFSNELKIWRDLKHPNIVQLLGTAFDKEENVICFVMELCQKSLDHYLHKEEGDDSVRMEETCSIAKDIILGLKYLHARRILHRDVKPKNVLLVEGSRFPKAKLCDFGMTLAKDETATKTIQGKQGGTLSYMAPELLQVPSHLSNKSDIFSFGILVWEIVERKVPYEGENSNAILAATLQGVHPKFSVHTKAEKWLIALTYACLAQDRSLRPSADEIYEALDKCEFPLIKDSTKSLELKHRSDKAGLDYMAVEDNNGQTSSTTASTTLSSVKPVKKDIDNSKDSPQEVEKKGKQPKRNKLYIFGAVGCVILLILLIVLLIVLLPNNNASPECTYNSTLSGDSFCIETEWDCSDTGCNAQADGLSYPLVKIEDGVSKPNPFYPNCESALNERIRQGESLANALKSLAFKNRQCPLPVGSIQFLNNGIPLEIENGKFRVSNARRARRMQPGTMDDVSNSAFSMRKDEGEYGYQIISLFNGEILAASPSQGIVEMIAPDKVEDGLVSEFLPLGTSTRVFLRLFGEQLFICLDTEGVVGVRPASTDCQLAIAFLNEYDIDQLEVVFEVNFTEFPTPTPTTTQPSMFRHPTFAPSTNSQIPTFVPSTYRFPTAIDTLKPTYIPNRPPTGYPSFKPTAYPTNRPSYKPTVHPTKPPTYKPTYEPTYKPRYEPTHYPTSSPLACSRTLIHTMYHSHNVGDVSVHQLANGVYHIVAGDWDNNVKVWNTETGYLVKSITDGNRVFAVTSFINSDGAAMSCFGGFNAIKGSHTVKLWNIETGEQTVLGGHNEDVKAIEHFKIEDEYYIISGARTRTAKLYDLSKEAELLSYSHAKSVKSIPALASFKGRDGRYYVVTGSDDYRVRIWEAESGKLVRSLSPSTKGRVEAVTTYLSIKGDIMVASGDTEKRVNIWYAETGKYIGDDFQAGSGDVQGLTSFKNYYGETILVCSLKSGDVAFWNVDRDEPKEVLTFTAHPKVKGDDNDVKTVASYVEKEIVYIVTGSYDSTVKLWNMGHISCF